MNFAFSTLQYGPYPSDFISILDQVAEAGFQGIEVTQRPTDIGLSAADFANELALRSLELTGLIFGSVSERVAFCSEMEVCPSYLYVDEWRSELNKYANEGFTFAIHPGAFRGIATREDARRVLTLNPKLRLIVDTAHQYLVNDDPVETVDEFMDRTVAVHLKDWSAQYGRSLRRYQAGFCALGEGDLGIRDIVEGLIHLGYGGWIVCETEPDKFEVSSTPCDVGRQLAVVCSLFSPPQRKDREHLSHESKTIPIVNTVDALGRYLQRLSLSTTMDMDTFLSKIPSLIQEVLECAFVAVYSIDHRREELVLVSASTLPTSSHREHAPCRFSFRDTVSCLTIRDRVPVASYETDRQYEGRTYSRLKWSLHSDPSQWFCIPVYNSANLEFCSMLINVFPLTPAPLQTKDAWFISKTMSIAADCILNRRCATVSNRVHAINRDPEDLSSYMHGLVEEVCVAVSCQGATVFILDEAQNKLVVGASTGLDWGALEKKNQNYSSGEDLVGVCWKTRQSMITPDCRQEEGWECKSQEAVKDEAFYCCMWVPWISQFSGKVVGVVRARNKISSSFVRAFTSDDIAIVEAIGDAAVPFIEKMRDDSIQNRDLGLLNHEVREPIAFIRGIASDVMKETDDRVIVRNCDSIIAWSDLISHEISNTDVFRNWPTIVVPKAKFVSITLAFEKALNSCKQIFTKLGIDAMHIDAPSLDKLPTIRTDADFLQRAFFCLLSNAIQYNRDPATLAVNVAATIDERFIRLDIMDNGVGIQVELQECVFEPGYRGPDAHTFYTDGEGLGLWVARCLLESIGGSVSITSFKSPTTLSVKLPYTGRDHGKRHRM